VKLHIAGALAQGNWKMWLAKMRFLLKMIPRLQAGEE